MKPGRNDPCPCGSGKKHKKCCALLSEQTPVLPRVAVELSQISAWMKSGRYRDVEAATRELLISQGESASIWKLHAASLTAQGKPAADALAQAVKLLPDDADLQLQWGFELLDSGRLEAAATHLERLIGRWPSHAEIHDSLGLVYLAQGAAARAADQHRQALALDPRRPEAHGNLGNALVELGEHGRAIEHYRAMLALQPSSAEGHNNLGNALLALRRYDEAAASYQQALALRPDAPGALFNLGNALREGGRPLDALPVCRRFIARRPEADGYRLLGHLQSDLGDLDASVASYRRSLEMDAASLEAWLGLGKTLRRMGRTAEAETACRHAFALEPSSGDALALLAELQADHGEFEEANRLLRQAIAASPDQPEAWAALAQYQDMRNGDPDWLAAVTRVVASPISPAQEINLRYALGKFHDDQGHFVQAFENFRRANDLQRRTGIAFDRARLTQQVEHIRRRYDRRWADSHERNGAPMQRPVFIIGMPRSGTSLIEQILASHPAVFGAGELRYWNLAAARFERGQAGQEPVALEQLAEDYRQLLTSLSPSAERVVDKMPANFMHVGLIHAALPGARIIHVRRSPLDNLLSIYFQAFSGTHAYAHDLADIAEYYRQYRALMTHWQSVLAPGVMLEVGYEALVNDPDTWIRRLVEHVQLPWDARCLQFHQTSRVVTTASNWQVRQTLNTRGIDRWRHYEPHLAPLAGLLEGYST